jgi:hypothetical protein
MYDTSFNSALYALSFAPMILTRKTRVRKKTIVITIFVIMLSLTAATLIPLYMCVETCIF